MTHLQPATALAASVPLVVPSLFAADHAALADATAACADAGARRIHVDVMDGSFVPMLGLSFAALASLVARFPALAFDVHLMTTAPERDAEAAADAGAASVTIHLEAARYPHVILDRLARRGVSGGIALSPATPAEAAVALGEDVAMILVMLINPGHAGEILRPSLLAKLARLRVLFPAATLVADGGVTEHCIAAVARAGANHIVCGGALFGRGSSSGPATALPLLAARMAGA